MIRPILACIDPYEVAEEFSATGWNVDFLQPLESGDPLVGVYLCGNFALKPTKLTVQPWGDMAFEVIIGGYQFMIAAAKENGS